MSDHGNERSDENTLAPGELSWMYPPMDDDVREVLDYIAPCREETCPVPQCHPFYHCEILDPSDQSQYKPSTTPCMPVVPTQVAKGKLFVMGDYPTAKFTARSTGNKPVNLAKKKGVKNYFFVPIGDIFVPMQNVSYFDGYKIRYVASGTFFWETYLDRVGVKQEDVWMTNLVKCYLFHQNNVDSYKALGWTDVPVEETHTRLLQAAKACVKHNNITRELSVCNPRLILTVGQPNCTITQGLPIDDEDEQKEMYTKLLGVKLYAGKAAREEGKYVRTDPWFKYNMFHMYHPEAIMYAQTDMKENPPGSEKYKEAEKTLQDHERNLETLKSFLEELGLVDR